MPIHRFQGPLVPCLPLLGVLVQKMPTAGSIFGCGGFLCGGAPRRCLPGAHLPRKGLRRRGVRGRCTCLKSRVFLLDGCIRAEPRPPAPPDPVRTRPAPRLGRPRASPTREPPRPAGGEGGILPSSSLAFGSAPISSNFSAQSRSSSRIAS